MASQVWGLRGEPGLGTGASRHSEPGQKCGSRLPQQVSSVSGDRLLTYQAELSTSTLPAPPPSL